MVDNVRHASMVRDVYRRPGTPGSSTPGHGRNLPTAVTCRIVGMATEPVNVTEALASFTDIYSPRIVARVNDYDVRVAHADGEHVWHVHDDTDEFFLILDG